MFSSSVELRMMKSVVPYGYEYLSPHAKLVMTPLTERCFQILLIALDLHQVSSFYFYVYCTCT